MLATVLPLPIMAKPGEGKRVRREFPPVELKASRAALNALTTDISGYAVEPISSQVWNVWLRDTDGQAWIIAAADQSLESKFEVFTLAIETLDETHARWLNWQPPAVAKDVPENFRTLLTTRYLEPKPPEVFLPWPFRSWRTEVVRRAEVTIEDVDVGPTFGDNPVAQDAVRPGEIPSNASASTEVAVGILFSDATRRLLIAADWAPMRLLLTDKAAEIESFLQTCETVPLTTYAARILPTS